MSGLDGLAEAQQGRLAADVAGADRAPTITLWLIIGLSAAGFLVMTSVAVLVVSVVRPLTALRASARAITAGEGQGAGPGGSGLPGPCLQRDDGCPVGEGEGIHRHYQPDGGIIVRADKAGRFTFLNDAACQFYGRPREDLLGVQFSDYVHPDDIARLSEVIREGAARREIVRGFVNRQVVPMGTRVVEWNGYPLFDEEGQYAGLQATGRDITERRRAEEALREREERFRQVAETAREWIWEFHPEGHYTYSSPAVRDILGYEPEEMTGKHFLDLVAADDRNRLAVESSKTLANKRAFFRVIVREIRKDGHTVVVESTGLPIVDADGNLLGCRGVNQDISERKQAEEALQKAREDIESKVERQLKQGNGYGLTFRELTVLHLVAAGQSDKEIATVLGISPLTAHKHIANILKKMGAGSRTEAGVRALREGLLE